MESSKDAVSKLSFTLLLFHHIVQLVWYFTHLHLLRFKSRKLSPEDAWHNSISTESLSNLLWMSFLLLYLQIALSLSSELDLSMILFENLSLKFYPLNHPYAVFYNSHTIRRFFAVTWSHSLITSGPQKSPLCSQCANHGVLSFSSTKCSSRPASVLWPNEMSVRKQSSSCLFAAVYNHVGCPAAGPAAFRHLVSQKKGSRVTKYRGAFQPWCR